MKDKICVVGSGPVGVTAAYALSKRGYPVVLIDGGMEVEPELKTYAGSTREVDSNALRKLVYRNRSRTIKKHRGIPAKLPFGSNYAYQTIPETEISKESGATIVTSLAKGGLSNSWGANICAVLDKDIADWPIKSFDLDASFRELSEFVEVSGARDQIDTLYQTKLGGAENFPLAPQAHDMFENARSQLDHLAERGIYFGRSKLALGSKYSTLSSGCISCGLCMHGCPYNLIFNSAFVLNELISRGTVEYLPGYIVEKFSENDGQVKFTARKISDNKPLEMSCKKLFVAAGVLGSTAIVARSMDWCDHEFKISDSTKYLFPFWRYKSSPSTKKNRSNTLAQLFMQLHLPQLSNNTVHLQFYGYNDLFLDPIRNHFGNLTDWIPPLVSPIINRLMLVMVYLHSNDSGHLMFKVNRDLRNGGLGKISGSPISASDELYTNLITELRSIKGILGGVPLPLLAKKDAPGNSQHFGGSLPMRENPDRYETDPLGRPFGCKNVHVIDSAIVPSVTGTPTTYTVMANAVRIVDHLKNES